MLHRKSPRIADELTTIQPQQRDRPRRFPPLELVSAVGVLATAFPTGFRIGKTESELDVAPGEAAPGDQRDMPLAAGIHGFRAHSAGSGSGKLRS